MKFVRFAVSIILVPLLVAAEEKVDLSIVHRIKQEAFRNSKVMDYLFYLSDVNGPRLAGSPGYRSAADWSVKALKELGLEDARTEEWGSIGRGWTYTRCSVHMLAPQETPLFAIPQAWTPGTGGPVAGEVALAPMMKEADFDKYKGRLKGKFVLLAEGRELPLPTSAPGSRYSDAELTAIASAPDPGQAASQPRGMMGPYRTREEYYAFRNKLNRFLADEGVLGILITGFNPMGGIVSSNASGSRDIKDPVAPPTVSLMPEHFNRLARLLEKKIPVRIEMDVRARFLEDQTKGFNVIADLPGAKKKDEIVMLGAHLDSWHGATGATDNAAGVAVVLEAVRILRALPVKLDRTVRVGLWDAEEEGLFGSKGYVQKHFADPETMSLRSEHSKLSVYFNYDNGGGKIRGIYLQENDMARPVFEAWLAPFKDLGASTVSIRNTGGTDHLSFDAVGLPGFQFIQDPLDYDARTHHTNLDVYDRIQKGDLMQAAAIMASFVYNAATRPEMMPRKPLPQPQSKKN